MPEARGFRFAYSSDADILEIGLGVDVQTSAVALDDQTCVHVSVETGDVVGFTVMNFVARFQGATHAEELPFSVQFTPNDDVLKDLVLGLA